MGATRITKQDLGSTVFTTPAVTLDIAANVASGSSGQAIQTDAHITAFDTTNPSTQASGDSPAVGSAAVAARRDHKHGMPTIPSAAAGGTPAVVLGTAAAAGVSSTFLRDDDTIAAFDATVPGTAAFGDSAAAGSVAKAARRDHTHGMPANPVAYATPAVTLGTAAAAGVAASAIRTDATLPIFDATAPSTQAFGDSAAVGSAAVAARRDHKHAMMANPGGLTASNFVYGESPSGTINGVNPTFTLANTPTGLSLYKNGLRQAAGAGNDYTLAAATITFLAGNIPQTGDVLMADYSK
jgi:hypothetical protein